MLRALPTLIFCDIKCLLSCYLWPKTPVGFTEGAGGTLGLQIKGLLLLIHSIPPHVTQAILQRPQAENNSHTSYKVHLPLPLLAFSNDTSPKANGKWSDIVSMDRMAPKKPDVSLDQPDLLDLLCAPSQAKKAPT